MHLHHPTSGPENNASRSVANNLPSSGKASSGPLPKSHPAVIQPMWNNGAATMQSLTDLENIVQLPPGKVQQGSEASHTLTSGNTFYVAPAATMKIDLTMGDTMQVLPAGKHIIGESEHGSPMWNYAVSPWPYVTKMRERYKSFEKPGEEHIGNADKDLREMLGGETRRNNPDDLALEGVSEYAVGALTLAQQMLKGYDTIYDDDRKPAERKKAFYDELQSRLNEVYFALLRYKQISANLSEKPQISAMEKAFIDLGIKIFLHGGFEKLKKITRERSVPKLGGFLQRNLHKDIEDIQVLITMAVTEIIKINNFTNMKPVRDLIAGKERNLQNWDDRAIAAITAPRDIRETEMARRINAGPAPLLVQVGKAHIPGLTAKGANGFLYTDEEDFIRKTTKKITSDFVKRLNEDSTKHRTMNLWG
jgi:hypothetical protein